MGLSTRLAKSTPPQIPSHAIHPNSRHLFGIRQHREFYSAQDFKTDQEPLLDLFYKHTSKPHSFYPISAYHSEYWTLSDAAGGANVSLSAIGEAHHLTLRVTNSITCTRASWSSNLELRPTINELTCSMPQGRNPRQMLRKPSRSSEYVEQTP